MGVMLTALVAAIALPFAPVLQGPWNYSARNEKGKVIASGTMFFVNNRPNKFDTVRSMENWAYYSTRMAKCTDPAKYGPHANELGFSMGAPPSTLGVGHLTGANLTGDQFEADMNVGMNDNNIRLGGKLTGKTIKGDWYWSTFAGARVRGTFTLTRQPLVKYRKAS